MEISHWSLSDSKPPQISRTLLSMLVDCISPVVWMILILPLISSSPTLFSRFLGTDSGAPITTGITVTIMFHYFFSSLARSWRFFALLCFRSVVHKFIKSYKSFLGLREFVFISKSQRISWFSFSRNNSDQCIYPTPSHRQNVTQGQFFYRRFEFRVFLHLD